MTELSWEETARKMTRPYVVVLITTAVVVMSMFNINVPDELWASAGLIIGFLFGERSALKVPGQNDTGARIEERGDNGNVHE